MPLAPRTNHRREHRRSAGCCDTRTLRTSGARRFEWLRAAEQMRSENVDAPRGKSSAPNVRRRRVASSTTNLSMPHAKHDEPRPRRSTTRLWLRGSRRAHIGRSRVRVIPRRGARARRTSTSPWDVERSRRPSRHVTSHSSRRMPSRRVADQPIPRTSTTRRRLRNSRHAHVDRSTVRLLPRRVGRALEERQRPRGTSSAAAEHSMPHAKSGRAETANIDDSPVAARLTPYTHRSIDGPSDSAPRSACEQGRRAQPTAAVASRRGPTETANIDGSPEAAKLTSCPGRSIDGPIASASNIDDSPVAARLTPCAHRSSDSPSDSRRGAPAINVNVPVGRRAQPTAAITSRRHSSRRLPSRRRG